MPLLLHGRKQKRRRKSESDWLHVLQQSRSTVRLRAENSSSPPNTLEASSNQPGLYRLFRTQRGTTQADVLLPAPNTEVDQDVPGKDITVGNRAVRRDDSFVAAGARREQHKRSGSGLGLDTDEGDEHASFNNDDHFRPFNGDHDDEDEIGPNHNRDDDNAYQEHPVEQNSEPCSLDIIPSPGTPDSYGCTTSETADMNKLQRLRKIWECSRNLAAVVSVVGSVRYTVDQYNFTRDLLGEDEKSVPMPPYKGVHQYFIEVLNNCLPYSTLVMLPNKSVVPVREQSGTGYEHGCDVQDGAGTNPNLSEATRGWEKVRIFLPSSWAKLDVATSTVFHQMYPGFPGHPERDLNRPLEYSRIVQQRETVTNACDYIFASQRGQQVLCHSGYRVNIIIRNSMPVPSLQLRCVSTDSGYNFTGIVAATWSVGSSERSKPSFERAVRNPSLTTNEVCLKALATAHERPYSRNTEPPPVLSGDVCTLLRYGNPEGMTSTGTELSQFSSTDSGDLRMASLQ